MARVLIVPCGCRGRALAASLVGAGHAVRGTTRTQANMAAIHEAGAEPYLGDPDRIGTLMDALAGVTIVCWLMGTIPEPDLVYEGSLPQGEEVARTASRTWQIPLAILDADPLDHAAWLASAHGAVDRLLA